MHLNGEDKSKPVNPAGTNTHTQNKTIILILEACSQFLEIIQRARERERESLKEANKSLFMVNSSNNTQVKGYRGVTGRQLKYSQAVGCRRRGLCVWGTAQQLSILKGATKTPGIWQGWHGWTKGQKDQDRVAKSSQKSRVGTHSTGRNSDGILPRQVPGDPERVETFTSTDQSGTVNIGKSQTEQRKKMCWQNKWKIVFMTDHSCSLKLAILFA